MSALCNSFNLLILLRKFAELKKLTEFNRSLRVASCAVGYDSARRYIVTLEITRMKKLLVLALGLGIVLGTVSFAQDSTGGDKKMEKKGKKKKGGDDTDKK
jgi:hypothetical protein